MSIDHFDGFDLYAASTDFYSVYGGSGGGFSTTGGRFGGGAFTATGTNDFFNHIMDTGQDYMAAGCAFKVSGLSTGGVDILWFSSSTSSGTVNSHNCTARLNPDGSISLLGDGTERAISSSGVFNEDQWYYIELITFRNTAGSGAIYINGMLVASASGADFVDSTGSLVAGFGTSSTGDSSVSVSVDDIYVAQDASTLPSALGDVKVETVLPDGDTAQADWTAQGAGAGYVEIDDALGTAGDGDTTYIHATTLNDASEFDVGSISSNPEAIHAVQAVGRATKTDAGTIEYTAYLDSSGTESAGDAFSPSESGYSLNRGTPVELDPNGGGAWTETAVNAVKLGVKITG